MPRGVVRFIPVEVGIYYAVRVPNLKRSQGRESRGPCPIHDGKDDNFVVNEIGEWYCHSRCGRGGGIIALEMALSNADYKTARDEVFRVVGRAKKSAGMRSTGDGYRRVHYVYSDEAGAPLFRVVRRERGEGVSREKLFHAERFEEGRWIKGLGEERRVIYRLPEVLAADQVFICEGEKDSDSVAEFGLVATTCPLGAGKWLPGYSAPFHGKHAVVLTDNDGPGRAHAIDRRANTNLGRGVGTYPRTTRHPT